MKTSSLAPKAMSFSKVSLTPKELVKRHMFNRQHVITDEEWKQLQVGVVEADNTYLTKRKSKAFSFINSLNLE